MTQDRTMALFFEIYEAMPRQGPGDPASTLRALSLLPGVDEGTRMLDLGCGSGLHTRLVARHSPAQIIAIDNHPPFIEKLNRQARADGAGDRIEGRVGDMRQLDFPPGSFDLVWCEGAIYNVGFEDGLRAWRPLLEPGGHLVVSEVCWAKPDPPDECAEFWAREYPAIRTVPELLAVIGDCGYDLVTQFAVPPSAWWDEYYAPLQERLVAFRARHDGDAEADAVAAGIQGEIDMWRAHGSYYSYNFFVMRRR